MGTRKSCSRRLSLLFCMCSNATASSRLSCGTTKLNKVFLLRCSQKTWKRSADGWDQKALTVVSSTSTSQLLEQKLEALSAVKRRLVVVGRAEVTHGNST